MEKEAEPVSPQRDCSRWLVVAECICKIQDPYCPTRPTVDTLPLHYEFPVGRNPVLYLDEAKEMNPGLCRGWYINHPYGKETKPAEPS